MREERNPPTSPWNHVNWHAVTEMVRRMQTRLVKALEQGHLGQAKKLQRLLVNSTAAKLLAVRQVVSTCFDKISHEWVLEHVPLPHHVLEKWLKAGVLDGGTLEETTEGTPQGGIYLARHLKSGA